MNRQNSKWPEDQMKAMDIAAWRCSEMSYDTDENTESHTPAADPQGSEKRENHTAK